MITLGALLAHRVPCLLFLPSPRLTALFRSFWRAPSRAPFVGFLHFVALGKPAPLRSGVLEQGDSSRVPAVFDKVTFLLFLYVNDTTDAVILDSFPPSFLGNIWQVDPTNLP